MIIWDREKDMGYPSRTTQSIFMGKWHKLTSDWDTQMGTLKKICILTGDPSGWNYRPYVCVTVTFENGKGLSMPTYVVVTSRTGSPATQRPGHGRCLCPEQHSQTLHNCEQIFKKNQATTPEPSKLTYTTADIRIIALVCIWSGNMCILGC